MSLGELSKDQILGYECKHAFYCRPPKGEKDDFHLVKERIHLKDGTTVPNVRMIKNHKRPFWITKKGCRDHEHKKEYEVLEKLEQFETTQSDLIYKVARSLEMPWFRGSLRDLQKTPYLYGTDISSTALIKAQYLKQFPQCVTGSSVAGYDTETSMVDGTILMATITFKERAFTAIRKDVFEGFGNVDAQLRAAFKKYVTDVSYTQKVKNKETGEMEDKVFWRKVDWQYVIVDTEVDIVKETIAKAHEWKPDFLEIWNINFDMPKIIKACERAGVNPKDIFSDPAVPKEYRFFKYKEGTKIKKMASGKESSINMADQWHTVMTPASFYVIDGMCVYRKLRVQKGELPRYGLDYVLDKEKTGVRKLNFKPAENFRDGFWHEFMQEHHPIEYVVYNVFDCIAMEILDEKILDLAYDVPESCSHSDYWDFSSQPKRTVDELHHYLIESVGGVIGTTAETLKTDLDKLAPPNTDLIVNLKAHLITEEGLKCLAEFPDAITRIYLFCFDLDVSAAYPSNTMTMNVSKETNRRILCRVEGKTEFEMRMNTINFSGGHTNSVEFATAMFDLPQMRQVLDIFKQEHNLH